MLRCRQNKVCRPVDDAKELPPSSKRYIPGIDTIGAMKSETTETANPNSASESTRKLVCSIVARNAIRNHRMSAA